MASYGPGLILRPGGDTPIPLLHGYAALTDDGLALRWSDEDAATCPAHPLDTHSGIGSARQLTTVVPRGPGADYFAGRAVRTHVHQLLRTHAPVAPDDTWLTLDPVEARLGAHVRGTLLLGRGTNAQGGGPFELIICADLRNDCSVLPERAPDTEVHGTIDGRTGQMPTVKIVIVQKSKDEPRQNLRGALLLGAQHDLRPAQPLAAGGDRIRREPGAGVAHAHGAPHPGPPA